MSNLSATHRNADTIAGSAYQTIATDQIVATTRRVRGTNDAKVLGLAENMAEFGLALPIEVVAVTDGYSLVAGAHRLAAAKQLGWEKIDARVYEADAFKASSALQIREITENLIRAELTALDRACGIARWKERDEAQGNVAKRGGDRKSKRSALHFDESFSRVASEAFDLSERSIQTYCQIANHVSDEIYDLIYQLPCANSQRELLLLAMQPEAERLKIAKLLASENAASVAEAFDILHPTQESVKPERWRLMADKFSKLKPKEQHAFFELNSDAIEEWMAGR
jgi:ParB family chromosome partitioning protein